MKNICVFCGSSIHEAFSATMNNEEAIAMVESSAKSLNLDYQYLEEPFRWSEDFGRFADVCPICLFGLGCGEDHLPLHNPEYIFEDEILQTGIDIFEKICTFAKN